MGCRGSKQTRDAEELRPRIAASPGQATTARDSQSRPKSRTKTAGSSSGRPASSRQGKSSRQGTSSRQGDYRKPQARAPLAQVEEEPADEEIKDDFRTLISFIDQHVHNFYRLHDKVNGVPLASFVRREIGMRIINRIIVGKEDGRLWHFYPPKLFFFLLAQSANNRQ